MASALYQGGILEIKRRFQNHFTLIGSYTYSKAYDTTTDAREQLEFVRLMNIVGTSDGNLGAHIVSLKDVGYLEVEKDFVGKKPRTRVRLTKSGRRAFEN